MNEPKLNVDYGKTAYVSPCGARMLDAIEQSDRKSTRLNSSH